MIAKQYKTAAAFRTGLENRLQKLAASEAVDVQRLRRQVAFDRFLCRLFQYSASAWVLKGGYAMELRIKAARTTRDIDLGLRRVPESKDAAAMAENTLLMLQKAAGIDMHDFFGFRIGAAIMELEAAPYFGMRYPAEAIMDGRTFCRFHVDVSAGDVLHEQYELLKGRDWLGFAGVARGEFPSISEEEQFAEKMHAYTLLREGRDNSRVKDLVDMVLLIDKGNMVRANVVRAIYDTYRIRRTHAVPKVFPTPPASWMAPFADLAKECGIDRQINTQFSRVAHYVMPILAELSGRAFPQ
ncbi:MAG: nucleotidyl transferase AbiEii/AbiGii toxin family protein [Verrucomicrobiota bacterium]